MTWCFCVGTLPRGASCPTTPVDRVVEGGGRRGGVGVHNIERAGTCDLGFRMGIGAAASVSAPRGGSCEARASPAQRVWLPRSPAQAPISCLPQGARRHHAAAPSPLGGTPKCSSSSRAHALRRAGQEGDRRRRRRRRPEISKSASDTRRARVDENSGQKQQSQPRGIWTASTGKRKTGGGDDVNHATPRARCAHVPRGCGRTRAHVKARRGARSTLGE